MYKRSTHGNSIQNSLTTLFSRLKNTTLIYTTKHGGLEKN